MTTEGYTRTDLAKKTGISWHLIHKYIKMKLLPTCTKGERRWCRYDDRHVRRIELIKRLHNPEQNTLEEIRPKLEAAGFE
jgi:DNA-binding transcriptional MerR regulator